MRQTSLDNISKLKCWYSIVRLLDAKVEQESENVHIGKQTYSPFTLVKVVKTLWNYFTRS